MKVLTRTPPSSTAAARPASVPTHIGATRRLIGVLASVSMGIGVGHLVIGRWQRGVKWFLVWGGFVSG
jgi:hypothetical protein